MFTIANPLYDTIFKYMMRDERAAACLLSAILDRDIELLEILPQEHLVSSSERNDLSILRFDYRATVREPDGSLKKILIELQKIKRLVDIARFRRYLGENYAMRDLVNGESLSLPITTIYLLGFELEVRRPVIRVGRQYIDPVTKEIVQGTDAFIEALTHDAYFVQIPQLPEKQQTRVERVLSLFSQRWVKEPNQGGRHLYLQLPDEYQNEDTQLLVKRLTLALADQDLKRQAEDEESFDRILLKELGEEFEKGLEEGIQKGLEEGIQKGIEEGIQKGREEGLREGQKSIALKLKNKGTPLDMIADITGFSIAEIDQLG